MCRLRSTGIVLTGQFIPDQGLIGNNAEILGVALWEYMLYKITPQLLNLRVGVLDKSTFIINFQGWQIYDFGF
ncbi:hypothetical protein D3C72_2402810 [compost metagenome]